MNVNCMVIPELTAGVRQSGTLRVPHATMADEWTTQEDRKSGDR